MKAILMSIKPQHVANILNEIKTLEIRKRFPKDYVGWIYIYCTKDKPFLFQEITYEALAPYPHLIKHPYQINNYCPEPDTTLNGKVVARFWCDKVVEYVNGAKIVCGQPANFNTYKFILKDTCLTENELYDYCEDLSFKAIHITKLEIFDKPKEIKEFKTHLGCNKTINCMFCKYYVFKECTRPRYLTRVPQSYCFIEV